LPSKSTRNGRDDSEELKRELKIRTITASVVAPFVVACFVSYYSLIGLVAIVTLIAGYEYVATFLKGFKNTALTFIATLAFPVSSALYGWLVLTGFPAPEVVYLLALFSLACLSLVFSRDPTCASAFITQGSFALLYISLGLSFFFRAYKEFGGLVAVLILLSVWVFDIGAYFVGVRFGKLRISPSFSPKKSFEGVVGGFFATLIFVYLFDFVFYLIGYEVLTGVEPWLLALTCAIMGTLGDISESALKRYRGVKDVGNVLPGHGGMLDRIDGLLFVVPTFFLLLLVVRG